MPCEHCSAPLSGKRVRFCSKTCANRQQIRERSHLRLLIREQRPPRFCGCGKPVMSARIDARFCSKQCRNRYHSQPKARRQERCVGCDAYFTPKAVTNVFCSTACRRRTHKSERPEAELHEIKPATPGPAGWAEWFREAARV